MVRLTIDGVTSETDEGSTILAAAARAGIEIPSLCADPRLAPSGACRLCIVAVDGSLRPQAACTTPVADGMTVRTRTAELDRLRRTLLELLAHDYPADAAASDDEPFHRLMHDLGVAASGAPEPDEIDDSHPLIRVDLTRCISCWRCVHICDEVQGQFVWRIVDRGADTRIVPDSGSTFAESSCVSCGACVDTCPTGALEDKNLIGAPPPTAWTRTTCPYCGVGCEMSVGTRQGRILTVVPAVDAPVNRGHLCVKGRYAHEFVTSADRRTSPMVRDGTGWRSVSWTEAIGAAAQGLRRARDLHGSEAVGVLGSARATNEDNYLIQKLARVVLGTNNVDCCARVCHAPSAAGLRMMLGTGAATSAFADIEEAGTILVCGSNPTENHPIVGARIKQAKLRGSNLVVIDPRRIELAEYADIHLAPRPGTTVALLNAMAAVVVEEDLVDDDFVASRVDGVDEFRRAIARTSPASAAVISGVDADLIRSAARLYAGSPPAISFHGLGVTEQVQGTEGVMCLVNLALLTGNVGRPGSGVNPLRGQNNVQGAAHMGCEPAHLPGYAPLEDARERVMSAWDAEIPEQPGLDVMQMLDRAALGELRALYVAGWDILLTQPNARSTRQALATLDTLVVCDLFLTETARELGTVFLPAASAFEKDGTFMNSERRVQRVRAAVPAQGDAKADWEIVCLLAAALGDEENFRYSGPEEIWEEIRRVWAPGAGISYARLERPGGLQWPCPDEEHPGSAMLHGSVFGADVGTRARLRPVPFVRTTEQPSDEYPFVLVTGRSLYQFNAGTMTGRSATRWLRSGDRLDISAVDAEAIGIASGATVRVRSRYGAAELPAQITERVAPGTVFATFSDPAVAINAVTGTGRDPYTHTPEYKVTAVRLERVRVPTAR
jgi:formate dehydrogenase major subunit